MKREKYLDILRVIAMFAVMFNHSWGYFSCDKYQLYAGESIYYVDVVLNTLTRVDVPIFLMISGYLMLKCTKYSNINNCLKKVGGVLKLIVIWVILYTIGHVFLLRDIDVVTGLKSIVHGIKGGYYYYNHLWYLYVTICLYLITPLLHDIVKQEKKLNYMLIIWIICGISIPLITHYIKQLEPNVYFNMNYLGGYIGYYLLGYKIGTANIKNKNWPLLFLVSWLVTSAVCILNMELCHGDTFWQNFMSPGIICMSLFLFLAIKQRWTGLDVTNNGVDLIGKLSGISLGVYLLHFYLRDVFMQIYWAYIRIEWLYMIFEPIILCITTILIVTLLSRIKVLKRIFFSI